MSKIDELIEQLCPDGVEYRELNDVIIDLRTGLNPRKNFILNEPSAKCYYITVRELGLFSINPTNKTDLISYEALSLINNRSHLKIGDVLFSGTGTIGRTALITDFPNDWNIKEGIYAITPKHDLIDSKYLIYVLHSTEFITEIESMAEGGTVKSVSMKNFKSLKIPIPPMAVQEEIVRVLDSFTELEAELEARKAQYTYYRDHLLTFHERERVRWVTLGEISELTRGKVISKDYLAEHSGQYPVYSSQTSDDGIFGFIDNYQYDGDYITWTTDGANAGSVFRRHGKFNITNVCGLIEIKVESIDLDFLFYWLTCNMKRYVSEGMGNPKLMSNVASKITIPLLSIEEQQRIVDILDKFDALVNDLTSGLPTEIEARQRQYAYYRDKLLTFKEKVPA